MPTFREDLHLGHKVALWETDDIRDKAVTTDKLDDLAVTTEKLADSAVTTEKIKDGAVTTEKIGDGEVRTQDIADGAVTTDKILDDNVNTSKIGDKAVTTEKIADENVTTEKLADLSVTTPKIGDKAVTREKLGDNAIPELLGVMDEFVEAVREEIGHFQPITINGPVENAPDEEDITSVDGLLKLKDRSGLYGYAMKILRKNKSFAEQITQTHCIYVVEYDFDLGGLTIQMPADSIILFMGGKLTNGTLNGDRNNGLGNNNSSGEYGLLLCSALYYEYLNNVTLTGEYQDETSHSLQDQINAIVMDKAVVSLSASPATVFVGQQYSINLQATTNTSASSIKIKKGSTVIASGSGSLLSGSDSLTPASAGNTTYVADFVIAGLSKATTKSVAAVYPIRIGSGASYVEGTPISTPKTSPAGTYNIVVLSNGDHVFFNVPATMTINRATMSGFDFPLDAPEDKTISGVAYKSYKSGNTYDAGTITVVLT